MTSEDLENRDERLEQMRENCRLLKKTFCEIVIAIAMNCIVAVAAISFFVYLTMLNLETGKPIPFYYQKWFVYSCISIYGIYLVFIIFIMFWICSDQKKRLEKYKEYGIS